MSDNIPFDMQMEIIKRVSDVKSLIRFRSVSKQWKSFVDSSEFIACYGARRSQPHHLLLRYKEAKEDKEFLLDLGTDVASPNVQTSWDYNYTLKCTSDANSVWLFSGLSLDRLSGPAESNRGVRSHGKANGLPLLDPQFIQSLCLVQDPT
nr:hypothetical protein [Tanacetum cinerariifolium]